MKICFITDKFILPADGHYIYPNGASVLLRDIIDLLGIRGHICDVIQWNNECEDITHFQNFIVRSVHAQTFEQFNEALILELQRDYDVTHFNNIDCLPSHKLPMPVTGTVHTNNYFLKSDLHSIFREKVSLLDELVVLNDCYTENFPELKSKLRKIDNFVDTELFSFNSGYSCTWPTNNLLFTSRQVAEKGTFFVLDLAKHLKQKYGWLGSIRMVGIINSEVYARAIDEDISVDFIGYLDRWKELPLEYKYNDIMLLPSLSEACSLVSLEALSSGCVVVANKSPGMTKLLDDHETGFLMNLDLEAWSKLLLELMQNNSLFSSIQNNGRRLVEEKFNSVKSINSYLEMWEKLCSRK